MCVCVGGFLGFKFIYVHVCSCVLVWLPDDS